MPDAPILDEYTPELMIDRARGLVPLIRKQAFEAEKTEIFQKKSLKNVGIRTYSKFYSRNVLADVSMI